MEARRAAAVAAGTLLLCLSLLSAAFGKEQITHKKTYYSHAFELGPGDVIDSYKSMEFPTGHIGIRGFKAEMVDDLGNSVPLYDVYLHHWVVSILMVKKGFKELTSSAPKRLPPSSGDEPHMWYRHAERMAFKEGADPRPLKNEGFLQGYEPKFIGMGSETRHTDSIIPSPYAIESGGSVPEGYEEAWFLNVHAIDTIGVVDAKSCFECLCESYGVTTDSQGKPLKDGYIGGLECCYDKTRCAVRENYHGEIRKFYFKYEITWVEWDESVIPIRFLTIDVTDTRTSLSEPASPKTEYSVEQCSEGTIDSKCIDRRHSIGAVPVASDVVLVQLHQHAGGLGGILYKKDGTVICSSDPKYGKGSEAGDEAGYVVGITTCYPEPGTIHLESTEELHFDAYYSNKEAHTGVMSIFYLYLADPINYIAEVTD